MTEQPTDSPISAAPVSESNRLKLVDALRGVALLGILLMNIPIFSMPDYFAESFNSDPKNINFWVDAFISILFEGKMRALFGMLFGAGVLLFVAQKEAAGRRVGWLTHRRMLWMVVFGLIHAHLILWIGDILYFYGVCGMILYWMRNWKPWVLALGVPIVAVFSFASSTALYTYARTVRLDYIDAVKAREANQPLSEAQEKAMKDWRDLELTFIPNREDAKKNTEIMKSGYSEIAKKLRPLAFQEQTLLLPLFIGDSLALMMLGMALYRWGFLNGRWTTRQYLTVMAVGYGLGLPLVTYSFYHHYQTSPNLEAALARMEVVPIPWTGLIYPFQRILLVMAHVAGLILIYKAGWFAKLFRALEAVGQMAFTNYIMHSIICTLLFFGYGFNWFATLEYYQLFYVVGAIWLLQLIVSPLWLTTFRYGPLEWVWRSLTYWKWQPFLRNRNLTSQTPSA